MNDYSGIALDVLVNPEKYRVNRGEKMERSVNVAVENINKRRVKLLSSGVIQVDGAKLRGYGAKKKQGD